LYRLIEAAVWGGETITYRYDEVGNRITAGARSYVYDDNDRLIEEREGGEVVVEYSYDNNGNLLSRTEGNETVDYIWDDRNRLIAVEENGERVEFEYDDDNIRVSQTVGGQKTSFLLDKNRPYDQVLAEFVDGEEVASYVYGLDLISQERNGVDAFYFVDGLGSTRGLTDATGGVTDAYWYDAYGNLVEHEGDSENDYLFAGEQFDEALGQYYLRQRYYDAATGRFTRRDTYEGRLEEPISLHKYLYTGANPVNYIDPSGLSRIGHIIIAWMVADTLMRIIGDFFNPLAVDPFSINIPNPNSISGATSRSVVLKPSRDVVDSFTQLNMHRVYDDTLPVYPIQTGNRAFDGVVTRLETGGQIFHGYNSRFGTGRLADDLARREFADLGFLNPSGKGPSGAFASHAEGHAFIQAYRANALHGNARLFIDTTMCAYCGMRGGVKNAFLSSGLDSLEVFEIEVPGLVIKTVFEK